MEEKVYQHIKIPGQALCYEDGDREHSKFWNEGKWNTFINPLLPEDCLDLPFLEIGSNCGLFLKMAEDRGFRKAIGIERHPDRAAMAERYRESAGGKFEILNQSMNASFDWTQLPRLGMTLIANTHYYMEVDDFAEMINSLRNRSLYCLVVSTNNGKKYSGKVAREILGVRRLFNDWTEVGAIENISTEGDPAPREGMYSILFKSNLQAVDVEKTWNILCRCLSREDSLRRTGLLAPMEDFYRRIAAGEEFDIKATPLYDFFSIIKSPHRAYALLVKKKALAEDIKKNGIKNLIYYDNKVHVADGISRLAIARSLGYKKIIAKII